MGNEKFCLRWNDFESNISVAFRELREDKDFFDVTLACDDEQIQAHKVILSACSPFFRTVLRRNPHAHPLLYLRGVRFSDLQSVLNFMYHGEVNVAQEELNSFLMVAEELRVKGLTQTQGEGAKATPPASMPSRPESQPLPLLAASSPLPSTPPPAKRPRPSTAPSLSFPNNTQPEVQQVSMPPVKSEPVASGPDESTSLAPLYPDEEQYEDYPEEEHYAEDHYSHGHHSSGEVNKGKPNICSVFFSFPFIALQPLNCQRHFLLTSPAPTTKTKMKYSVKICASKLVSARPHHDLKRASCFRLSKP